MQQLPDIGKHRIISDIAVALKNILSAIVRPVMLNPVSDFIRGVDAVTTVSTVSSITAGTITTVTTLTNLGAYAAHTVVLDTSRASYANAVRNNIA